MNTQLCQNYSVLTFLHADKDPEFYLTVKFPFKNFFIFKYIVLTIKFNFEGNENECRYYSNSYIRVSEQYQKKEIHFRDQIKVCQPQSRV